TDRDKVLGGVSNEELLELMKGSHFFVLPTLNENFGYVFLEALAAGCPLIISENTIWSDVARRNAGFVILLSDEKGWQDALASALAMDQEAYRSMSLAARAMAEEWLADPGHEAAMVKTLEYVIAKNERSRGQH
ncbi:MAG TPA: glycosyltransferase, partial [Pyrinomonadaceae bacterium]|nr:glycosyltransferase [Pyrinomonadaceae bacterium]